MDKIRKIIVALAGHPVGIDGAAFIEGSIHYKDGAEQICNHFNVTSVSIKNKIRTIIERS